MTFQVIILRDDHYFYQENRFYKEFFEISKIGVFTFHVLFNQKFPDDSTRAFVPDVFKVGT